MTATLHRLKTAPDRLRADKAAELRQMLLAFPDLPDRAASELLAAIDRSTAAENGWTFVMMSPADNAKVVSWLAQNCKRPVVAVRLWAELFLHLRRDTGEVVQTRDELAETVGAAGQDVSRIMTQLESIGAITRKRQKVAGMKGPGMVRYFMNPVIGTHQSGQARDKAQAEAPKLRIVETGNTP
jgi:CRP-like cAMP-binding protein